MREQGIVILNKQQIETKQNDYETKRRATIWIYNAWSRRMIFLINKQQNEDKQKYIATKKSKSNKTKQIKNIK